MLKKLLGFIKSQWIFTPPKKKNILLYDREGKNFANLFFKKSSYSCLDTRLKKINIFILLCSVIKKGFRNLGKNYYLEYIQYVKPKLVINFLDNNLTFYTLKRFYQKGNFTSIQTSTRDKTFFEECQNYYKNNKDRLEVDNFFTISENDKLRYSKFIKSNYQVIGTLKNNLFYKTRKKKKFNSKKKILFISQQGYRNNPKDPIKTKKRNKEKKIFDELYKLSLKKGWDLSLSSKNSKKEEIFFRKNMIVGNWKFIDGENISNAYKAINSHDLIVFTNSTLGLEALSKNIRCLSFPPNQFPVKNFNLKYPKKGPFWSCKFSKKILIDYISRVENYSDNQWNYIVKKYVKKIMYYDHKNKNFNNFLKKKKFK